jgi:hypothetical protein
MKNREACYVYLYARGPHRPLGFMPYDNLRRRSPPGLLNEAYKAKLPVHAALSRHEISPLASTSRRRINRPDADDLLTISRDLTGQMLDLQHIENIFYMLCNLCRLIYDSFMAPPSIKSWKTLGVTQLSRSIVR